MLRVQHGQQTRLFGHKDNAPYALAPSPRRDRLPVIPIPLRLLCVLRPGLQIPLVARQMLSGEKRPRQR